MCFVAAFRFAGVSYHVRVMTYNKDGIFTVHLSFGLWPKPMAMASHLGIEELFSRYRLATPSMELGH